MKRMVEMLTGSIPSDIYESQSDILPGSNISPTGDQYSDINAQWSSLSPDQQMAYAQSYLSKQNEYYDPEGTGQAITSRSPGIGNTYYTKDYTEYIPIDPYGLNSGVGNPGDPTGPASTLHPASSIYEALSAPYGYGTSGQETFAFDSAPYWIKQFTQGQSVFGHPLQYTSSTQAEEWRNAINDANNKSWWGRDLASDIPMYGGKTFAALVAAAIAQEALPAMFAGAGVGGTSGGASLAGGGSVQVGNLAAAGAGSSPLVYGSPEFNQAASQLGMAPEEAMSLWPAYGEMSLGEAAPSLTTRYAPKMLSNAAISSAQRGNLNLNDIARSMAGDVVGAGTDIGMNYMGTAPDTVLGGVVSQGSRGVSAPYINELFSQTTQPADLNALYEQFKQAQQSYPATTVETPTQAASGNEQETFNAFLQYLQQRQGATSNRLPGVSSNLMKYYNLR
jgi:hypothetical protein